jgi:hypothetical protein
MIRKLFNYSTIHSLGILPNYSAFGKRNDRGTGLFARQRINTRTQ